MGEPYYPEKHEAGSCNDGDCKNCEYHIPECLYIGLGILHEDCEACHIVAEEGGKVTT